MSRFNQILRALETLPAFARNLTFATTKSGKLAPSGVIAATSDRIVAEPDEALLITARRDPRTPWGDETYALLLDLDVPAKLIRSSSGNSHLYVDVHMTKAQHDAVMNVLAAAGVIQHGFAASAVLADTGASLRPPWVKKGEDKTLAQQTTGRFASVSPF